MQETYEKNTLIKANQFSSLAITQEKKIFSQHQSVKLIQLHNLLYRYVYLSNFLLAYIITTCYTTVFTLLICSCKEIHDVSNETIRYVTFFFT